ncbi:amino acid/polyamine transporter I [Endogone sp. FLAS-F59071]|nr:amino acid/polyamine transporter I [Endogone sp. FLAS-F59071]|eukprot:RUS16597.1 amino acid/polyamine transporter I [Endogone sp. FLAS-F59071]
MHFFKKSAAGDEKQSFPEEEDVERQHQHALRKDAISVVGAAAMAIAFMGPAAMIVALLIASAIAEFARKIPTAGFAYSFNMAGFGKVGGFLSGWILMFSYFMIGPMLLSAIGALVSQFFLITWNITLPWWMWTIIFSVICWLINLWGVSQSAIVALIFLVWEVSIMLALSLTILAKGGAEGINGQAFNPQYSNNGVSGLGIGLLWCIQFFIGFESAGTLGEETRNPRRNIPIALFFSVTVIGIFYVLGGWAAITGYGINNMNTLLSDPSPWITLGQTFWRPGIGWLISLTVLNSIFANLLSGVNAAVRVIYAMGREGLLPSFLGRTNSRRVPFVALTLYMVVSLALALGASFGLANEGGPLASYGFFGTLLGLGIVLTYILINLALISFYWRKHRQEFNWLRHFALPIIASVIMILPIYGIVYPVPALPNNLVPYIMLGWIVIGVVYVGIILVVKPSLLDAMGKALDPSAEQEIVGPGEN